MKIKPHLYNPHRHAGASPCPLRFSSPAIKPDTMEPTNVEHRYGQIERLTLASTGDYGNSMRLCGGGTCLFKLGPPRAMVALPWDGVVVVA